MPNDNKRDSFPPGITLGPPLEGHEQVISRIAWSSDGKFLASSSLDRTVRLWNVQTGRLLHIFRGHEADVNSVVWSPDGSMLASGSNDQNVILWDVQTRQIRHILKDHSLGVNCVAWSPDGSLLASGSTDQMVLLWDVQNGKRVNSYADHNGPVISLTWQPGKKRFVLASGSEDQTIRIWDALSGQYLRMFRVSNYAVYSVAWSPDGKLLASDFTHGSIGIWHFSTGRQTNILEGHTSSIRSLSFSNAYPLLASESSDDTIRIWRTDTWEQVAVLRESTSNHMFSGVAFHPNAPVLATLGDFDRTIRIWNLDIATLLGSPVTTSTHYTNAKVVLVGDSGVGKSGLGLVLTKQPFTPTESTHGRHVWPFDSQVVEEDGRKELREILLWDLAGQPGYRLIHQLHLNEVTAALIVFDSHSDTDPFAGVYHWARALQLAELVPGVSKRIIKKFLVAARVDRGGKQVSRSRIDQLVQKMGFDGYFETSAKEAVGIDDLAECIKTSVDWEQQLKITSNDFFQRVKRFLLKEKQERRRLAKVDVLYQEFRITHEAHSYVSENVLAQFEMCISQVESQGLIRRLSFGNLILLQPELLDAYASSLINEIKDDPDGWGRILENKVRSGDFAMYLEERISNKEQEKLLLIAMVEDLLRYEITLREEEEDGAYLIFPSQSTRENPDLPDPEGRAVIFQFEGPVLNIYTTLAVRLSYSGHFMKKELWKNAIAYTTEAGGTYGLFLRNLGEGLGELNLFFDHATNKDMRVLFEEYVYTYLHRRALPGVQRRRIFICSNCGIPFTEAQVKYRQDRGLSWITCSVCDTRVSLFDKADSFMLASPSPLIPEMDRAADAQITHEAAKSIVQGKIATHDFDVLLCYSSNDKEKVMRIAEQLEARGILPWLNVWKFSSEHTRQIQAPKQIEQIKSAVVFVGKNSTELWQQVAFLEMVQHFIKRDCPVIPAILADVLTEPVLPSFLEGKKWVDFREQGVAPMEQLINALTTISK